MSSLSSSSSIQESLPCLTSSNVAAESSQEMECGCRVAMMMLSICAGIQHGLELRENIQKIANGNGINIRDIPMVCRNLVHKSIQEFDRGWEEFINICGLNSMEIENVRYRKRTSQKRSKENGKQTHT